MNTIVSRGTGAGVAAGQIEAGGSVLTTKVRNTLKPGTFIHILLTGAASPCVYDRADDNDNDVLTPSPGQEQK